MPKLNFFSCFSLYTKAWFRFQQKKSETKAERRNKKRNISNNPKKINNNSQLTMDVFPSGGTVLLRSVSIFLGNRRQSKLLKEQAQKAAEKKKKTKTLSKLDEQMGKLQPKVLENLKRKTHFNKWVIDFVENNLKCGLRIKKSVKFWRIKFI